VSQASYWERGVDLVPQVTGASSLLDASDMASLADDLGFALPLVNVLDVGCGTGRISRHCDGYVGADISRDAVEYCRRRDIDARVIAGPSDLAQIRTRRFNWVTCMSVFTHIDEFERVLYLGEFAKLAPSLLVDIIPGDGRGDVALWTMAPVRFESMLRLSGYDVARVTERKAPIGTHTHRYYYAKQRAK
jgi:hypothetical protein